MANYCILIKLLILNNKRRNFIKKMFPLLKANCIFIIYHLNIFQINKDATKIYSKEKYDLLLC